MAEHAGETGTFPLDVGDEGSALERSRALLDAVADGRYRLDDAGHVDAVDDGFLELTGYDREALVGRHVSDLLRSDDVATAKATIEAMLANDLETATLELPLERADGERVPCRVRMIPIRQDGEFRGTVGVVRSLDSSGVPADAAARDRSVDAAGGADDREGRTDPLARELDEVFERVDDAFYALDDRFRFTYVNDRAAELLQHDEAELLGRSVWAAFPGAVDSEVYDAFHEALESQEQVDLEFHFDPLDLWVEATVYPSESGLSVYFRDASDRRDRERALEESERRYRAIAEHFPNGVVTMFDRDLRYTLAAGQEFESIGLDPADLEGERVADVWDDETAATLLPAFRAALDGEERTVEVAYGDSDYLVHCVPVTHGDGTVFAGLAMTQEVTGRKRLREELQRHNGALQRLYEVSAGGEHSFDDRVREVLELGRSYLGTEVGFLAAIDPQTGDFEVRHAVGDDDRFEPGTTAPLSETYCRRTMSSEGLLCVNDAPREGWVGDPAYAEWDLDSYLGGTVTVDGEAFGTLCFVSDGPRETPFTDAEKRFVELATQWVSYELERRDRERDLREYREYTDALLDAVDDVFYTLDESGDLRRWNESLPAVTGYDDAEIEGMDALDFFEDDHREPVAAGIDDAFEEGSCRIEAPMLTKDGEAIPYEFVASSVTAPDGTPRLTGIGRDVSDREEREAELERRQRQQRVVAELGQLALETDDLEELAAAATELLAETLGTDYAGLLELDAEAGELELRQLEGTDADLVGRRVKADDGSQSGYTLGTEEPVVVEDLDAETRFDPPAMLTRSDVASGLSTIVGSVDEPWGVLTAHATDRHEFTDEDVSFVQSVANVLASAVDRRDHERRLEQQRERLQALNSLHEVIHGITDAAVERSTREEIERAVCERLAASDSYRFAWVGDVDTDSQTVVPRAAAGTDGYLDEIEVSIDPDDPRSNGPAGRAYLTGEVQASQHVRTDPRFEPWREHAERYGFRSSASIPIVHEETVFGVLNVYAERPYAFAEEERGIVERVGEIVGHAIAAVERKRALTSDEVLEVEFRVRDVFDELDDGESAGRMVFDRLVPVDDDEYRLYGRVDADALDGLRALADRRDNWRSVRIRGDEDGDGDGNRERRFEVHASSSPLMESVADRGGVVESAVVEDGDLAMTVHLPQGSDVRGVIADVEARYPAVELLTRRQIERPRDDARETSLALTEDLTDRQQTALETAYHAGFFEWPRDSSGEELAEQLGIAPATFSQHLRAAERKLLESLFEELPARG